MSDVVVNRLTLLSATPELRNGLELQDKKIFFVVYSQLFGVVGSFRDQGIACFDSEIVLHIVADEWCQLLQFRIILIQAEVF